jgi:hypothetical protein
VLVVVSLPLLVCADVRLEMNRDFMCSANH